MANKLPSLKAVPPIQKSRKRRPSPNVTRMNLLVEQYGNHSVFTRIRNAVKDGRASLDMYRPIGSVKGYQTTDGLLELIRMYGMTITPTSSGSPACSLFIIGNLGAL